MSLRFGLLGTGHWADTIHAAGLAAHEEVEFVGVWGRTPEKVTAVAERHGVAGYTDLDALLADVEAVAIALPPDVQAELAVRAAAAGRHLLLEKPVALSSEGAERIVEATDQAQVSSLVFFTDRYVPAVQEGLRHMTEVDGWHGAHVTKFGSIYEPDSPYKDSQWRKDQGALWDTGPHALSVLLPVLGPVMHVHATPVRGDTVELTLTHAGGAVSRMALSLTIPLNSARNVSEFYGQEGFVALPVEERDALVAYGIALDELVQTVQNGGSHPCDAGFGRQVVDVLAAAQRSLETPPDQRAEPVTG